jgi:putative transposase
MRPVGVVMLDIYPQDPFKLSATCDQEPIETVTADGSDPALGERVGVWRTKRRADDLDALALEDVVEGIRIVKTPVRAPKANAIAERFVRTVRAECLDWLLILNRRHLEGVLRVYVDHYNRERPHRALELRPPEPDERRKRSPDGEISRRDRLGGLIHEYYRAAA